MMELLDLRGALVQIVILPSLDYEVFLGRNFESEERALFVPTARIVAGCSERGIPLTLFADVLSVPAYRAAGRSDFCDRFESQLISAVKEGHDAQLHIHANWASTKYIDGAWQLCEPKITLADYDYQTDEPARLIGWGATYLRSLLQPVDADYRCIAFRAGALAMQPDERRLIELLDAAGIIIDSSLAKGLRVQLDTVSIDYRNLPADANWWISSRSGLAGGADTGLFEIPIAAFQSPVTERASFLVRRLSAFRERRGSGISRARRQTRWANVKTLLLGNLRYLTSAPVFLFSADTKGLTRRMLVRGFQRYISEHEKESAATLYVSMINHPKLMFPRQEQMFFDTLDELQQIYGTRLRFSTYRSVAAQLQREVTLTA